MAVRLCNIQRKLLGLGRRFGKCRLTPDQRQALRILEPLAVAAPKLLHNVPLALPYSLHVDAERRGMDAVVPGALDHVRDPALATIVLVGVQPSFTQVPPTCFRSIKAT